jgi:hypothetical protein
LSRGFTLVLRRHGYCPSCLLFRTGLVAVMGRLGKSEITPLCTDAPGLVDPPVVRGKMGWGCVNGEENSYCEERTTRRGPTPRIRYRCRAGKGNALVLDEKLRGHFGCRPDGNPGHQPAQFVWRIRGQGVFISRRSGALCSRTCGLCHRGDASRQIRIESAVVAGLERQAADG